MKKLKSKIKKSYIILFAILIFFLIPIRASWLLNLDSDKPLELFSMNWDYDSSSHTYQNYVVVDDPEEKAELKQILNKWYVRNATIVSWYLDAAIHPSGSGATIFGIRCGNKILGITQNGLSIVPRYGITLLYQAYGGGCTFWEQVCEYWSRMRGTHEMISEPTKWGSVK